MLAQLAHRRMIVAGHLIWQWKIGWIKDAWFTTEETHKTRGLLHNQAGIRAIAQRPVEEQDARRVLQVSGKTVGRPLKGISLVESWQRIRIGKHTKSHVHSTFGEGLRTRRAAKLTAPSAVVRRSADAPCSAVKIIAAGAPKPKIVTAPSGCAIAAS